MTGGGGGVPVVPAPLRLTAARATGCTKRGAVLPSTRAEQQPCVEDASQP